jgi:signal transduction histidine kinase
MLTRTINLSHAFIYLRDPETGHYILKAKRERSFANTLTEILNTNPIVNWLNKTRKPILYEELTFSSEENANHDIAAEMKKLSASVIVPSFVQDTLIGFMAMGDKLSGSMFSQNDLAVFQVLANQSALAIENAMFYEETGKTLAQQFHEHRLRSIGTMGSMMGHQINNRFQAILAKAEQTFDIIETELEKIVPDQKRNFFNMAKESLRSIKQNAELGGSITKRLTTFSRKETQFKPIDLNEVITAVIELLSFKFDIKELNLKTDVQKTDYKIYGDMAQLQDILFNLLDNAHDAEVHKKETDSMYIPQTSIKAYIQNSLWQIEVSDNGIGMSREEYDQLFLPFFTTKATTEKGTGIGLAIIKSMVETHKGKITAQSTYGEGTTFYITLPATK